MSISISSQMSTEVQNKNAINQALNKSRSNSDNNTNAITTNQKQSLSPEDSYSATTSDIAIRKGKAILAGVEKGVEISSVVIASQESTIEKLLSAKDLTSTTLNTIATTEKLSLINSIKISLTEDLDRINSSATFEGVQIMFIPYTAPAAGEATTPQATSLEYTFTTDMSGNVKTLNTPNYENHALLEKVTVENSAGAASTKTMPELLEEVATELEKLIANTPEQQATMTMEDINNNMSLIATALDNTINKVNRDKLEFSTEKQAIEATKDPLKRSLDAEQNNKNKKVDTDQIETSADLASESNKVRFLLFLLNKEKEAASEVTRHVSS
ncbi:MAG: hypothetical protein ISN64_00450 [Rickettsia sp.]|nr:hypothetical protein [Rickettsia sp.]